MTAQRTEWFSWNDRIIAKADPIDIPAVAAFPLSTNCLLAPG
jgi:hypothetical protein